MATGPENRFKGKFRKDLQEMFGKEAYIQVNHGGVYSSGLPDLTIIIGGLVSWLELKCVTELGGEWAFDYQKQPTPIQFHTMKKIDASGGRAQLVVYFSGTKRVQVATFTRLNGWRDEGFKLPSRAVREPRKDSDYAADLYTYSELLASKELMRAVVLGDGLDILVYR